VLGLADLEGAARSQVGLLHQVPPDFAAIKQQGRPAYKAARAGETVIMNARDIAVHSLAILAVRVSAADPAVDLPPVTLADLLICCSKGTYIRAIARDLGTALNCGGHLVGLRRLASGAICTGDCVGLAELEAAAAVAGPAAVTERLLPLDHAVNDVRAAVLGSRLESQARTGRLLTFRGGGDDSHLRLYGESGNLIGTAHPQGAGIYHPDRVFAGATV
jgi:tRNA pseudouridine55 synthase